RRAAGRGARLYPSLHPVSWTLLPLSDTWMPCGVACTPLSVIPLGTPDTRQGMLDCPISRSIPEGSESASPLPFLTSTGATPLICRLPRNGSCTVPEILACP